jgi:hypothetical protein
MSLEDKLLKNAIKESGDETIIDVAVFEPKGSAAARGIGAAVGSLAGGGVTDGSSFGTAFGATAGMIGASAAVGANRHLPPEICVAMSPTDLYLFGMKTKLSADLTPIAKLNRDNLGVEVHNKMAVRTIVLEDLESGAKFPLEATKLNFFHAKSMIEMLMLSEEHHDTDEATEAGRANPTPTGDVQPI